MCITTGPSVLNKTKILSMRIDSNRNFIAYSNSVRNTSGKANAMILPIPGSTEPSMFHDTTAYKDFLKEIDDWTRPQSKGITLGDSTRSRGFQSFVCGQYQVGLAANFDGAEDFIDSLPASQRPEIGDELRDFFRNHYIGWSFAVCIFDSNKTVDAQPIAFEYAPFGSNEPLFFPTMDAHTGDAPKKGEMVDTDHVLFFIKPNGFPMEFKEDVPAFLKGKCFQRLVLPEQMVNGDTYVTDIDARKIRRQYETI